MWMILVRPLALLSILLSLSAQTAWGTVYFSKEEAFELAFGKGATVEAKSIFMTDAQLAEVERTAKVKLDSKLFTFHVGKRGEQVVGYAAIEAHTVRTQVETLLVVLSPQGELNRTEILAFHEPPEYKPPSRWFERLNGRPIDGLVLGQGVDGIAGATLSSRAALDSMRKVMAIFRVTAQGELSQ